MITLPAHKSITFDSNEKQQGIMKKRLITIPLQLNKIKPKEINKIIEEKKRYDEACEIYEAEQSLVDFERRILGNKNAKNTLEIPTFDNAKLEILRKYGPPSAMSVFDVLSRSRKDTRSKSSSKRVPNSDLHLQKTSKPSTGCPCCCPKKFGLYNTEKKSKHKLPKWNSLDTPEILTNPKFYDLPELNKKPFYKRISTNNDSGIPLLLKNEKDSYKRKQDEYNKSMKLIIRSENLEKEEKIKSLAKSRLAFRAKRREEINEMYIKSGQGWVLDGIKKKKNYKPPLPSPKLDEIDEMAIEQFNKREKEKSLQKRMMKKNKN